jgi:hypothetical protein
MNYLILFNSKVEKQVVLNNKYNKTCILCGSDPMPFKAFPVKQGDWQKAQLQIYVEIELMLQEIIQKIMKNN